MYKSLITFMRNIINVTVFNHMFNYLKHYLPASITYDGNKIILD